MASNQVTAASITRRVKAHIAAQGLGQVPIRTRWVGPASTDSLDVWQTHIFEDPSVARTAELLAAMAGYGAARLTSSPMGFVTVITETGH